MLIAVSVTKIKTEYKLNVMTSYATTVQARHIRYMHTFSCCTV